MQIIRQLSTVGLFVGTLFFAFSLTPSLLPRSFAFQGLVSGVLLTLGYAFGAWGRWVWSYLEIPVPGARTGRVLRLAATAICIVTAGGFLWRATVWQNSVRTLMNLPEVSGVQPFGVASMALVVFAALLVVARLFRLTLQFLSRALLRFLPRRVSNVIGVIAAAALLWAIMNGVIFTLTLRVADESYQQVETIIHDDMGRPDEHAKTAERLSRCAGSGPDPRVRRPEFGGDSRGPGQACPPGTEARQRVRPLRAASGDPLRHGLDRSGRP
jgi:uncharacterized membrane protein